MEPTAAAIADAAARLRCGGVVAYPTEAVFGLGCDPMSANAFERLFMAKRRPPQQGVLLIAAAFDALAPYLDLTRTPADALERAHATWPGPHTWIFPRAVAVPSWIAGSHDGIAVRVTAHATAVALCRAFEGALVSTSANRHGEPPARSAAEVRAAFGSEIDLILDGPLGGLEQPTAIRDAISGRTIR